MEERIQAMLEKHYQELIERLDSIEEKLALSKQHNEQDAKRLDRFQNKLISLEASLDEKLGLWEED